MSGETMFHELLLTFSPPWRRCWSCGAPSLWEWRRGCPCSGLRRGHFGNMVPVPFILLLVRRAFAWLRNTKLLGPKIVWLERRAHLKGRLVRRYRLPGLVILVAIRCRAPAPGPARWWRLCWISACATRCPPSFWAWSLPGPSSRH